VIKAIVADAGLLLPEAGTVGLDKFKVDLWVAHSEQEEEACPSGVPAITLGNRGQTVGVAMYRLKEKDSAITKDSVLFLSRRKGFVGRFTQGQGTTCGEWTRPVNKKGDKGFFKANPALGVCPVGCDFCYLHGIPFASNSLALNVGEFREQVGRLRQVRHRRIVPPIINLSETGGLLEWCAQYKAPEIVQAYLDASVDAGVTPYVLTKRSLPGLKLGGAHVGISLNPWAVMVESSPGASCPNDLLDFLYRARDQGASTVIRWGPVMRGYGRHYDNLADRVHAFRFDRGRFTVDLIRFSKQHPAAAEYPGLEFRAKKWQEPEWLQREHLARVRSYFPHATITGCKLDPEVAVDWVREGLIQAMPCACWK